MVGCVTNLAGGRWVLGRIVLVDLDGEPVGITDHHRPAKRLVADVLGHFDVPARRVGLRMSSSGSSASSPKPSWVPGATSPAAWSATDAAPNDSSDQYGDVLTQLGLGQQRCGTSRGSAPCR